MGINVNSGHTLSLQNQMIFRKKLEAEYNKKQIEIRMQAQNALMERERVLNEKVNQLKEELERQKESQYENIDRNNRVKSATCILQWNGIPHVLNHCIFEINLTNLFIFQIEI